MQNFPQKTDSNFYFASAVITLILNPLMFFLTIPALIFSFTSKSLYKEGHYKASRSFAAKSKRCTISAWAILFIVMLSVASVFLISRLSLI